MSESIIEPEAFPSSHAAGEDPRRPPLTCAIRDKPTVVQPLVSHCEEEGGGGGGRQIVGHVTKTNATPCKRARNGGLATDDDARQKAAGAVYTSQGDTNGATVMRPRN